MVERILLAQTSSPVLTTITLPEPRAGKPQAYIIASDVLQEVQRFKSFHSSWIVGDVLLTDGGLYLATPVDAVFVLLPHLQKSRNRPEGQEGGYFCSLEQILEDPQHPQLQHLTTAAAQLLPLVCDIKESGDCTFYRLNDDMVLAWLLVKVAAAQEALEGALGGLESDAKLAYVIGFLGDYLSEPWCVKLAQHLKVDLSAVAGSSATVGSARPAPPGPNANADLAEKRPKVDPKAAARKKAEENKQAALAKVSQGTKSITSFFKPRTPA